MPRIAIEDFNDQEVARIYLAAKFADAESVESELNSHYIDYAVEVEPYRASAVFWVSEYKGAAFNVRVIEADSCAQVLRDAGLTAGLLEKELR